MKPRILSLVAVLALLLGSATLTPSIHAQEKGLKVGEKAPSFTLKDQEGKERSLKDLLKKGKVALVFYRSASW